MNDNFCHPELVEGFGMIKSEMPDASVNSAGQINFGNKMNNHRLSRVIYCFSCEESRESSFCFTIRNNKDSSKENRAKDVRMTKIVRNC